MVVLQQCVLYVPTKTTTQGYAPLGVYLFFCLKFHFITMNKNTRVMATIALIGLVSMTITLAFSSLPLSVSFMIISITLLLLSIVLIAYKEMSRSIDAYEKYIDMVDKK